MTGRIQPNRYPVMRYMARPGNLLKTAIFTRIGIGVVRILETYPTDGHNPRLSRVDKWRAFWERAFIEVVGIASQVLLLYGPLEAAGHLLEAKLLKKGLRSVGASLPQAQRYEAQRLLKGTFHLQGLVADRLFHGHAFQEAADRVTAALSKQLADSPHKATVLGELLSFQKKTTFATVGALAFGVLCSAVGSGLVLQWLNDNLFSPKVVPWLLRVTGVARPSVPTPAPALLPRAMLEAPPLPQRTFRV